MVTASTLAERTRIFRIFMNAIRNRKTMVVDAVIDPVIVSRNTGRQATNKVAILGLLLRYMRASKNRLFFCQAPALK